MKIKAISIAFAATLFTTLSQAQDVTVASRTGTVFAGGPARTEFTPNANSTTIRINKTAGRAQTIVNFYINGVISRPSLTFERATDVNGRTLSRTLTGVQGRRVRVEIVNQSIGNRFSYTLRATTPQPAVAVTMLNTSGTVYAPGPARRSFRPQTNAITVRLTKTGGRAQTIANVYVDGVRRTNATMMFANGNDGNSLPTRNETITGVQGRLVRIEIVNQSVANSFRYRLLVQTVPQ